MCQTGAAILAVLSWSVLCIGFSNGGPRGSPLSPSVSYRRDLRRGDGGPLFDPPPLNDAERLKFLVRVYTRRKSIQAN